MAYINSSGQISQGPGIGFGLMKITQTTKVTLTSAQLLTMFTTPVQILPAPPANSYFVVEEIVFQTFPTTTAYATGGAISLVYHGGSVSPHASSIPAATLISGTGTVNELPLPAAVVQIPVATGIDITNATAVFSLGTGTATVKITYHVGSSLLQ